MNRVEAYKWFNLAAAQSMANVLMKMATEAAALGRKAVALEMTSGEIAEAQRLSAAFVPRMEARPVTGFERFEPVGRIIFDDEIEKPQRPRGTATGFFITGDGFLITNEHVVRGATEVLLVTSTGTKVVKVLKVDAANDLALLKVDGKFVALPIVASRAVRLGNTIATVGFPNVGWQGFAPKLAKGEIASLSGAQDDPRYFQISAPVQPGNSGGALVDERGNVVGVVSAKLNPAATLTVTGALPENVNYAIKSSLLLSFLESVPEVSAKLQEPNARPQKFEDVVKAAEQAAALVVVY